MMFHWTVVSALREEKLLKLQIVIDYNCHMGYMDKGDRMADSYSISHRTFKWTNKLFFHLLDLTILNSYILHSSCWGKNISHRDFSFSPVRNMLALAAPEWRIPKPLGRPPKVEAQVDWLNVCSSRHWPILSETQLRCCLFKARGISQKFSSSAVNVKWDCVL